MKKTLLVLAVLTATFSACKKEDQEQSGKPVKLLSRMATADGTYMEEYKYDSQNHLTSVYRKDEEGVEQETLTYDNSGKLIKYVKLENDGTTSTDSYIYDGNTVQAVSSWSGSSSAPVTNRYLLNDKGQLLEIARLENGQLGTARYTWEYDANEHTVKAFYIYTDGRKYERDAYSYDNNPGIMANCTTPEWWFTKEREYSLDVIKNQLMTSWSIENSPAYKYEYEFDADGYPVSVTEKDDGSVSASLKMEYIVVK